MIPCLVLANTSILQTIPEPEYHLDDEDIEWLRVHPLFGEGAPFSGLLSESLFEKMIEEIESKCSQGATETIDQAQAQLAVVRALNFNIIGDNQRVMQEVYNYVRDKHRRIGKPLLRRLWPIIHTSDNDYRNTFRREDNKNMKRGLRRSNKSSMEAYRKLQKFVPVPYRQEAQSRNVLLNVGYGHFRAGQ